VVPKFEVDLNASRPVGTASAVIAEEVDGQGRPRAKRSSRSDSTKGPWLSLPREYLHCMPSLPRHRDQRGDPRHGHMQEPARRRRPMATESPFTFGSVDGRSDAGPARTALGDEHLDVGVKVRKLVVRIATRASNCATSSNAVEVLDAARTVDPALTKQRTMAFESSEARRPSAGPMCLNWSSDTRPDVASGARPLRPLAGRSIGRVLCAVGCSAQSWLRRKD